MVKIPILTYHSHKILGNSYETNDHVALHHDLRIMGAEGFLIVPLYWVVEWYLGKRKESLPKCIAITFDDGCNLDWIDYEHPQYGFAKSFRGILLDFKAEVGDRQPYVHAPSFVIGSPMARRSILMVLMITGGTRRTIQDFLGFITTVGTIIIRP
jgi:hypothetical protein